MTEQEAKQAALDAGIREDQITPQHLAFFGYECKLPTEGVVVGPVIPPDNVKTDVLSLEEEGKKNQLPAQIASQVMTVVGFIKQIAGKAFILLALLVALNSCGVSTQAVHSVDQAAISVKALNEQHLAFEEKFIQKYEVEETARIQALYEAGMASSIQKLAKVVQKTVKEPIKAADGTDAYKDVVVQETVYEEIVPVNVANALQSQRIKLFQAMQQNMIVLRSQQAQICANAANAAAYLEALNAYFTQRQVSYESMMAAEQSMFSFLETFLKKE